MNILILDAVSEVISSVLTEAHTTTPMDITVSYGDATSTGMTEGVQLSASDGTTPKTICSAPAASTRRLIRNITVYNKDSVTHTIILKLYAGGVYYGITKQSITAGETWSFGESSSGLLSYASSAEVDAGTDNSKYVTPKAIADSNNVPNVVPSTAGNILTSDGSVWTSTTPPSNRNAIINGAMDIWQRGTATITPASVQFFPDRWRVASSLGDGTYNLAQNAETPTATFPFQFSLRHDTTHIETAVAAGEYSLIQYGMEGYDFKRFEGQTATLSFWVKSVKTGIFCVAFQNSAQDKSYVHEFTINTTNTWEKKTITLTFNSGGTFLYTNGLGVRITWTVMCGSTQQIATANKDTWQSGLYFATDAQVNGMDNTNNKFYLTGVQMELGSVATPFEFRPIEQELALCQRYYARWDSIASSTIIGIGQCYATAYYEVLIALPVTMRDVPTLDISNVSHFLVWKKDANTQALTSLAIAEANTKVMCVGGQASSTTLVAGDATFLVLSATAGAYLAAKSEL